MLNEYTFKWLPISLQCFPALNMPICNSQYISRSNGFVNTGISELSLPSYGGLVWTVAVYRSHYMTHWGVNIKLITILSVIFSM